MPKSLWALKQFDIFEGKYIFIHFKIKIIKFLIFFRSFLFADFFAGKGALDIIEARPVAELISLVFGLLFIEFFFICFIIGSSLHSLFLKFLGVLLVLGLGIILNFLWEVLKCLLKMLY